ncbi:MAG: prolyl oligopeptidase [Chlamydiales bacterium]|jgi:prolyl oligopeptidase
MHHRLLPIAAAILAACQSNTMPDAPPDAPTGAPTQHAQDDPYLWLEDVLGDPSLDWVRTRNADSQRALSEGQEFGELQARILSILDSTARIPHVTKRAEYYYNLWQDSENPRGLWRRTTLDEYRRDDPTWETVLDLDALGAEEGENWVWKGSSWLMPDRTRCLLSLSRGGADATVVREFDLPTKQFVADGFVLPEAKSDVSWHDRDSIFVGTDFGDGSLTESGYPRVVKLWKRGTPLSSAQLVAEGELEDVAVTGFRDQTPGFERDFVYRAVTFYTNEMFVLRDGVQVKLDKQDSAMASTHREWLFIELRDDWSVGGSDYSAGSLLAIHIDAFLDGARDFDLLFEPTERTSLAGFSGTRNHLLLNVLDNVKNRIWVLTHGDDGWQRRPLPGLPELGTIHATAVDDQDSDDYWLIITDYLTPTSLWMGTIGDGRATKLKTLPEFFDTSDLAIEQCSATSEDGTEVPYFLVMAGCAQRNGENPTLLTGYGGFEVSLTPNYSATIGASWLERGGAFAVANIRGGGEFGPSWHQAALKANRNKCYEDFAAVARDLIDRKITSPRHLGIQGGSNGGLLMGNMTTMYPELFRAVVCQVPLLDMLRYHLLLAGASWMGEYGDPDDPVEAEWLRRYSPYHNLDPDSAYPKMLFTTSTRDDRVHPGHARKMMARMLEQGHDVLYYENIEGGHGGAADNKQAAFMSALAYSFLWQTLP